MCVCVCIIISTFNLKITFGTCPKEKPKFSTADQKTDKVAIFHTKKGTVAIFASKDTVAIFDAKKIQWQSLMLKKTQWQSLTLLLVTLYLSNLTSKSYELNSQGPGRRRQVMDGFHMDSIISFHRTEHGLQTAGSTSS